MQPFLGRNYCQGDDFFFQRPNPKGFKIETKSSRTLREFHSCQPGSKKLSGYDEALLTDMNGFAAEALQLQICFMKGWKTRNCIG